ncbi:right-handed parallel beta-helix repeat-containing protein [Marinicella gelatinilytica]|uniref:hypothetical protein n=1 Tax=Marinicella gelatinilytica TaxID=2996017 RepID=UPI002260D1A3|nr:hypothetical protein [Marinicella gelatinilytica]MCX7543900.1 hypothetical protein [Marinicella gelatinilytica]
MKRKTYTFIAFLLIGCSVKAADYHIGPGQPLSAIADVDWTTLQAGDRVYIHWRSTPYREKWVINVQGTAQNPISIIGVNGPNGQQPVIDGENAVTVAGLNFWNELRGVIKIGGSNVPSDGLPQHIIIENLDIRSGHPDYQFTNDEGQTETYSNNAAAIYVEKAAHLTIRNCSLSNSGNGLFIGAFNGQTENILIEKNHIYGNGVVGRIYEHNTYTAAIDITYQFNRFGPLKAGAGGNNLKDRSAGLVVAYNWIEGGNRQLDLVDAEDSSVLVNHPSYNETHVYGNILIEPDNDGNSQMIHYGGDSGTLADYRKGTLHLYNNTFISQRSGNTTLVRLSTNDESTEVFNNIYYGTASGHTLALMAGNGTLNYQHNWLKTNYSDCHCSPNGVVNNLGNQITGSTPDFIDLNSQNYRLNINAASINQGMAIPTNLSTHSPQFEYQKHQQAQPRLNDGILDIGAYETIDLIFADGFE